MIDDLVVGLLVLIGIVGIVKVVLDARRSQE